MKPWLCEGCKNWLSPSANPPVVKTRACMVYGNIGVPPKDKIIATIRYCRRCK